MQSSKAGQSRGAAKGCVACGRDNKANAAALLESCIILHCAVAPPQPPPPPPPHTHTPPSLLQVYAFSSENWRRPAAEVDGLLSLICRVLQAELAELAATGVRLRFIGELAMLPQPLQRQIRRWACALAGGWLLAAALARTSSAEQPRGPPACRACLPASAICTLTRSHHLHFLFLPYSTSPHSPPTPSTQR